MARAAVVPTPIISKQQTSTFLITKPARALAGAKLQKIQPCGDRTFVEWSTEVFPASKILIEERDALGRSTGRFWEDQQGLRYNPMRLAGCLNETTSYLRSDAHSFQQSPNYVIEKLATTVQTGSWNSIQNAIVSQTSFAPEYEQTSGGPIIENGGIVQVRGRLSLVSRIKEGESGYSKIIHGTSAITLINARGNAVTVNPPWFKDLAAEQIPEGGWITWYFSRFPNGFELIETRSDAPLQQTRYFISDGGAWVEEATRNVNDPVLTGLQYWLERDLDPFLLEIPNVGVAFKYHASQKAFLLHGIPNTVLKPVGYDVRRSNGHFVIRYALRDSGGRVTTWKALVQYFPRDQKTR